MPAEGGTEQVVVPDGGASSTADASKPATGAAGTVGPDGKPVVASGTPPDKSGDYEKRITGLTSDLQKERKARQQYDADLKAAKAELETERKRVRAALGIDTPSTADTEEAAIRERFAKLYPQLADLTAEDIAAIRDQRKTAQSLQETTNHYWAQHGRQMVTGVVEAISKELGGDLSDRQKQRIAQAYAHEAQSNEEFLARHEKGDKTLITEFAKQWVEDWVEPARRKATQQETQRFRPVPSGKDRNIVTHGDKKIDVNDPKAVEDFLVKGYRERNGEFSGRR